MFAEYRDFIFMKIVARWLIFGFILLIYSGVSVAGGQGGNFKIVSLRVSGDATYIQFSPAPTACNGGSHYRMHARVRVTSSENYEAMVSTLLSLYMSNQTLRYIWYQDLSAGITACSDSGGILELTMMELKQK